jgi:hypothetical protein
VVECFEHRRRWFYEVCGETPSNDTRDACAPTGWCWISRWRSFPRGQNVFAQSIENSEEPDFSRQLSAVQWFVNWEGGKRGGGSRRVWEKRNGFAFLEGVVGKAEMAA